MSTAWVIGGKHLRFNGHGHGTFDGNGQVSNYPVVSKTMPLIRTQAWYDFTAGESNLPGRPHALTVANTTNSVFQGIRFVQSQMW